MRDILREGDVYMPELLESDRNMDKVLSRLALFGRPTLSPPDSADVVDLAYRTIRSRLVENSYLDEKEEMTFRMTSEEAVSIATDAAKFMRADRHANDFGGFMRKRTGRVN